MSRYSLSVHLDTTTEVEVSFLPKNDTATISVDQLTLFLPGSPTQRMYIAQQLRNACDQVLAQATDAAVERHCGPEYVEPAGTMPCGCNVREVCAGHLSSSRKN